MVDVDVLFGEMVIGRYPHFGDPPWQRDPRVSGRESGRQHRRGRLDQPDSPQPGFLLDLPDRGLRLRLVSLDVAARTGHYPQPRVFDEAQTPAAGKITEYKRARSCVLDHVTIPNVSGESAWRAVPQPARDDCPTIAERDPGDTPRCDRSANIPAGGTP
jgi:hypothetical protein